MPYANWARGYSGSTSQTTVDINIRLTTTGSPAPIVGAKCLEMYHRGNNWDAPPERQCLRTTNTLSTSMNYFMGRVRTLMRVVQAVGPATGRLQMGVWAMLGTGSRIARHGLGRVLWMCEGAQTLGNWESLQLCYGAETGTGLTDWDLRYPEYMPNKKLPVLAQVPFTAAKTSVVALELEWYVPRNTGSFFGVHLLGRVGSALDYSDLVQVIDYTSVNAPDVINPAANGVEYLGLVALYDSWNGQLADVHTLFDQTAWDRIDAVPNATGRGTRARVPYKERKVPPVAPDDAPVAPLTT